MKTFAISVLTAMLLAWIPAHAIIWYVHPDSALNTIKVALDVCAENDTVLVGPGTYYENIVWPTSKQGIVLMSEYGPDTTIIDGQDLDAVITMHGRDSSTVINGFTIQNGSLLTNIGGGIFLVQSDALITNNIVKENTGYLGGGISLRSSSDAQITNNIITDNGAYHAGGIYVEVSDATITGNTITHNYGVDEGGGIEVFVGSSAIIIDNLIMYNICDISGGGISVWHDCNVIIAENTISNNEASEDGGGLFIGDPWWVNSASIRHNIISDNYAARNGGGIYCADISVLTIDSCTISRNNADGIYIAENVSPTIHYCDITDNVGYAVRNYSSNVVNAEHNWWGSGSGPYHPDSNPGGLGDTVSDYVDFTPWLTEPVGVKEEKVTEIRQRDFSTTIFSGPLRLPEGKKCRVFDITGRVVAPDKMRPGIYFVEVDGKITQKVVKIK